MSRDNQTLIDLSRSARLIIEFQQGIDKAALATDIKTQSAMLYHFLILGEAVKRLSPEFRLKHPEIPWSSIAGMRDRLIHDYDEDRSRAGLGYISDRCSNLFSND